jgi:hypothetical protein
VWIAWAGQVDELNGWFQRRSGCASAEPYPALKRDDWSREKQAKAIAKGASWKKNPFAATIILLLLRQFSLILFCPRHQKTIAYWGGQSRSERAWRAGA